MKTYKEHPLYEQIQRYQKMPQDELLFRMTELYPLADNPNYGIIQAIIQTRLNKELNENINALKKSTDKLKEVIEENNIKTEKYNKIMLGLTITIIMLTAPLVIDVLIRLNII